MCRNATTGLLAVLALSAGLASAQEWRHIGNSAIELGLPSVASGPVSRVWYSPDGGRLFAQTAAGRVFSTTDFEQWVEAPDVAPPPPEADASSAHLPEPGVKVHLQAAFAGRLYAFGRQVYRSDDGGLSWTGVTRYRGTSILGAPVDDLTVSPSNRDEVTVANAHGVWRSLDAGLSWTGLNQFLPNLTIRRILATPAGSRGVFAALSRDEANTLEWAPGEKTAWHPAGSLASLESELALRRSLSRTLAATITAVASAGDYLYAGSSDGRLWSSSEQGRTWRPFGAPDEAGAVESIFVDAREPRLALAALGARPASSTPGSKTIHVRRTINGGIFWDDLTANLPDDAAHGITADSATGAVYVATDAGVFYTLADLSAAAPATPWSVLAGLPSTRSTDVHLDSGNNQLWVALDGYGIYSTIAPHRLRDPRVVNAADYSSRPAAPGSLLSVLGAKIESAQISESQVPVLAASDSASQIQVPFEASGNTLSLTLQADSRRLLETIQLQSVSPAIFVDPDGAPLLLDADSGLLLDSMKPAHSGSRIQILATGLGRVKPDWPTGLAAPLQDPPKVAASVHAYLDLQPLQVTQSVLAPGYIGFYLIEVELPKIVNYGPAELYIEAEGKPSNRVRVYLEP